jgi:hypothetical protein
MCACRVGRQLQASQIDEKMLPLVAELEIEQIEAFLPPTIKVRHGTPESDASQHRQNLQPEDLAHPFQFAVYHEDQFQGTFMSSGPKRKK